MSRAWKQALKHKGLVIYFLKKNPRFVLQSSTISFDDFVQVGLIGLMKASKNFDPRKGAWSPWALKHIKAEIVDVFRKEGFHTVRIPLHKFRTVWYGHDDHPDCESIRAAMFGREDFVD